jgi:hypothetical protein
MSDRVHCDVCNRVISDDEWHLQIGVTLCTADPPFSDGWDRDCCQDCLRSNPWLWQLAEELAGEKLERATKRAPGTEAGQV